jgi:hypothetical protein
MNGFLDPQFYPNTPAQLDPNGMVTPMPAPGQAFPELPAPPENTVPEYKHQDPKRAAWAGLLFDLGGYFMSGARRPMQNLAMQGYAAAIEANRKGAEAQRQAKQQNWQNQYTVGNARLLHGQDARDFQYKTEQDRRNAEAAAATATREQQKWAAEHDLALNRFDLDQTKAINAGWTNRTLENGAEVQINPYLPEGQNVRVVDPRTTIQRGEQQQAEQLFLEGQAQANSGTAAGQAGQARDLLEMSLTEPLNVGDIFERGAQLLQSWLWSTKAGRNTEKLNQFLEKFTLENAGALKGAISDKDIDLLRNTKPTDKSDERVIQSFLYDVWAAQLRQRDLQAMKQKWIAEGNPITTFDENGAWTQLKQQYDAQKDQTMSAIAAGDPVGNVLLQSPILGADGKRLPRPGASDAEAWETTANGSF